MCVIPKAPKVPDPPPPPPTPAAPPTMADVQGTRGIEERRQIAANKNRILTSSSGLESQSNTGKVILGG